MQTGDDWRVTRRRERILIHWRADRSRLRRFGSRCSAMAYPCSRRSAAGSWSLSARQGMLKNRRDRASRQGASLPFGARRVSGRHTQQRAPLRLSQIIDRTRHFDLASVADLARHPVFHRADGSRNDGTQIPRAPAFPSERGMAQALQCKGLSRSEDCRKACSSAAWLLFGAQTPARFLHHGDARSA